MAIIPTSRADINKFLHEALETRAFDSMEIETVVVGDDGREHKRFIPVTKSKTKGQIMAEMFVNMAIGYRYRKTKKDLHGNPIEKYITVRPNPDIAKYVYDRVHGKIPIAADNDAARGPDLSGLIGDKLKEIFSNRE
jgi:hypothetical protein